MNRYVWALLVFPAMYVLASFYKADINPLNWPETLRGMIATFSPIIYIFTVTFPGWDD